MKKRRITTQLTIGDGLVSLGGRLDGRNTSLWILDKNGRLRGALSGRSLYRLAKAIVAHYESEAADV